MAPLKHDPSERDAGVVDEIVKAGGEAIVVHAPFGRRVLVPWSLALAGHVRARSGMAPAVRALLDFLVARYGEFVLLKPPLQLQTLLLWSVAPVVLLHLV